MEIVFEKMRLNVGVVQAGAIATLFGMCARCADAICQYFACAWNMPTQFLIERSICRSTCQDSDLVTRAGGQDNPKINVCPRYQFAVSVVC